MPGYREAEVCLAAGRVPETASLMCDQCLRLPRRMSESVAAFLRCGLALRPVNSLGSGLCNYFSVAWPLEYGTIYEV